MKYLRYSIVTILVLLFSAIYSTAEGTELTNIDDRVVENLQQKFSRAQLPSQDGLKLSRSRHCELFGMRSRLQTLKKSKFYEFHPSSNGFINKGSQVIKNYYITSTGLKGQIGSVYEEVRMGETGELISEISLLPSNDFGRNPTSSNNKVASLAHTGQEVIAYAVCGVL
jgi:hypothetical protein